MTLPVELFHRFIGQGLLFAAILPNYQQEPQITNVCLWNKQKTQHST